MNQLNKYKNYWIILLLNFCSIISCDDKNTSHKSPEPIHKITIKSKIFGYILHENGDILLSSVIDFIDDGDFNIKSVEAIAEGTPGESDEIYFISSGNEKILLECSGRSKISVEGISDNVISVLRIYALIENEIYESSGQIYKAGKIEFEPSIKLKYNHTSELFERL